MRGWVWQVNVWLALFVALAFFMVALYCTAHGVSCWAAIGFSCFFVWVAFTLGARAR